MVGRFLTEDTSDITCESYRIVIRRVFEVDV